MRIRTFTSDASTCEFAFEWDIALHGEPLDTRGRCAVDFIKARSRTVRLCGQDEKNLRGLIVDGDRVAMRDVLNVQPGSSVLLEATTLDLVELLNLLCAAEHKQLSRIDLLYAEPGSYQREAIPLDAPWRREFSLSDNFRFEGVPGFATNLSVNCPKTLVAFLGYEGARLAQASEQLSDMVGWTKIGVFGIPGYAPGWEMNALASNAGTLYGLKDISIRYCAASSVVGALDILEDVHARRRDSGMTVVAPLGTKPHTIASALFLVKHREYQESALVWDHPQRTANRSEQVRRWQLFRVTFDRKSRV